jgi:hypothetical protein
MISNAENMRQLLNLLEASGDLTKGAQVQPDQIWEGDLVELNGKTLVVVSKKMGRKFYEFSFIDPTTNKTYNWKPVIGQNTQQKLIYLGKSNEDDLKAGQQKRADRADAQYDTLRTNQDILSKLNLQSGQEVLIKFRNGNFWKTVEGVDYKSGQVSIVDDHTLNANPDLYRNPSRQKRKLIPANYILDTREGSETSAQRASDYASKIDQNKETAATKRAMRKMW